MSRARTPSEPLTRQACEPCRRKKTRCPGERPKCSFCSRLNVQCVYLPRGSSPVSGVGKKLASDGRTTSTIDRVQLMERQISHLYSLLGSSNSCQMALPNEYLRNEREHATEISGIHMVDAPDPCVSSNQLRAFTLTSPVPPIDVIEHFVDIYRTKVHHQPLPLFHLERLADQLLAGPQYLLWCFLSLMLKFTSHTFFENQESIAEDFYSRSSEKIIVQLALDCSPELEVIRSFCVLALSHMKSCRPDRAWIAIGNASRLYTARALFDGTKLDPEDDTEARAYWSTFALERLFLPCVSEPPLKNVPEHPQSATLPPPPLSSTQTRTQSSKAPEPVDENPNKDIGINGYSLQMISIWGRIRLYLHRLSQGEVEKPWLADSHHTRLAIELIEFEAKHSKHHLLLNVGFPNRSAAEIDQLSEYWNPWMTTELLWHSAQAILNHPFLHLAVLRSQNDIPQSCVFLQQKADMALYHVSWLFRILKLSEGLMEISNPILGDAIAGSATVLWLFQFMKDTKVAQRCRDDLNTCERVLNSMAHTWPHIWPKLDTLTRLRALAEKNRSQAKRHETTISYKAEWFWDLLLPSFRTPSTPLPDPDPLVRNENENDITSKMRLRSHFIDRLSEESESDGEEESTGPAPLPLDSFSASMDNLEQFDIEELSRDFLENDLWNLAN